MELVKLNDENSFDPTPKLKSSPVPIFFISFNWEDNYCIHCGEEYTTAIFCNQKYCKKCLLSYLTNITDNNLYLDVYLFTKDLECNEHEISRTKIPQNIQECCRNCLIVFYFKQVFIGNNSNMKSNLYICENVIESERYCKLCGKLLYQGTDYYIMREFKLCSNCYLISSGCVESTLTKKFISIIYLPFWEYTSTCYCDNKLLFISNCQKFCDNCLIFFIGCRYCLTTNIIFGITNQSQCIKCKRVSTIIFDRTKIISINSGDSVIDDFLINIRHDFLNQLNIDKFANDLKNVKYFIPSEIYNNSLRDKIKGKLGKLMRYIPYSKFKNVKKIAEGGFSVIYQATCYWIYSLQLKHWKREIVILKRFKNLQYAKKYFLKELESNHRCYYLNSKIIETFGFTKGPKLDDYILVMQYASEGDLHKYLQKKFTKIDWSQKLSILYDISSGLMAVHDSNFIHRDFHSGNILVSNFNDDYVTRTFYKIGDLGLSRSANDTSSDDEIYGVIPYIAPEIFKGSAFSKESDIYSLGMIMWELTTDANQFYQAELKREGLIYSTKLPKFNEKSHPKAIYTSRLLNSYISKCSSIFTKCSSISFSSNDYISKELELDIDIKSSRLTSLRIKRNIEELNIHSCENDGKRIKN
ncbi:uncharacterized protein OCT59_024225 [Rhizophagus irregularis]|uniref:uncharacterized protein n=1 Tax=Rhizophagus irregularis TaxID=588596 RepID=UPI0033316761|nr:hypothetical protein OCT59_024225 [Rhizophagus irregularis]